MSTLKDEKIQQGTRKRTDYENTQRERLAINVTLKAGACCRCRLLSTCAAT